MVEWKELSTQECDYYIWLSGYPSTEWDHAEDSRKVCETLSQSKSELGIGKANFLISWQGKKGDGVRRTTIQAYQLKVKNGIRKNSKMPLCGSPYIDPWFLALAQGAYMHTHHIHRNTS